MKLAEALAGVARVLLDTAPVVYHLEGNPRYGSLMQEFFRVAADGGVLLVTTPITLAECLVHPIRRGLTELTAAYSRLIVEGERTEFRPIGSVEASAAARLRAEHNLTLADSLQAAVALQAGCQGILTNDPAFKCVQQVRPLILDELEP